MSQIFPMFNGIRQMSVVNNRRRLRELIGHKDRGFCNPDGNPMYVRKGEELRRRGATDNCIVCGIPALPGVMTFAHIHARDLDLSPGKDYSRVCLMLAAPPRFLRTKLHLHHAASRSRNGLDREQASAEAASARRRDNCPHIPALAATPTTGGGKTNRILIGLAERLERGADTCEQQLPAAGGAERKPKP